jgi:hypothetical protein
MLVAACLIVASVTTMLAVHAALDRAALVRSTVLVLLAQISVFAAGELVAYDGRSPAGWRECAPAATVIAVVLIIADGLVARFGHYPFSLWPAVDCAVAALVTPLFIPWVRMTAIERYSSGDALLGGAAILVLCCLFGGGSTLVQCGEKNASWVLLAAKCSLCSLAATVCAFALTLGSGVGADAGGFVVWIGLYCAFIPSALFTGITSVVGLILGYTRLPSQEHSGDA